MRSIAYLLLLAPLPLAAQTLAPGKTLSRPSGVSSPAMTTKLSGSASSNPKSIAAAVPHATVWLRTMHDPDWTVTAYSDPQLPFTCAQGDPTAPAGAPSPITGNTITCSAIVVGGTVKVQLVRTPRNGPPGLVIGQHASGPQWGGDCAGTSGTECTLDLSQSRNATVDWSAKP